MRQIEVSRTLVFNGDVHARAFFEALLCENMDLGRPENVELLFRRGQRLGRPTIAPPGGGFKTKIDQYCTLEATVHNTRALRCRRGLDNFPRIHATLAGIAGRFATALDCADTGFIADGLLDQRPLPSQIGALRADGIDLNKPRVRAALSAALALAVSPDGFTVADHAAAVQRMTGMAGYTIRQSAYDLRKMRGKNLAVKPGRSRRYHVPPKAARTIAALLALRDQVIAPIIAGARSPRMERKPTHWTAVDRDYEQLRVGMQTLFGHLGITARASVAPAA